MTTMLASYLPLPRIGRGKVRDIYAVGDDRVLLLTTDRISAFDVVMAETIPMKGAVLTQISAWWFTQARRRGAASHDQRRGRRNHQVGISLRTDFLGAADRGELVVHYQPVYDLASEQVQGVEALVRWQHPTRGLLMPDAFLPAAESTGEFRSLTRFVLAAACRQAGTSQRELPDHRDLWVSVNISGSDIEAGGLVEDVELALTDSGLPPSSLVLELTESVLVPDLRGDAWSELEALQATRRSSGYR